MTEDLMPRTESGPVGFELLAELERTGGVTKTSLTLTEEIPLAQWEALGRLFGAVKRTSSFLIGDWINFGEAVYGEKYAQAADTTGLAPETLMVYASVCRRIARSRRREELSFGHHEAVAALEPAEQTRWLAQAVEHGWSRRELRDALRGSQALPPAPEQPDWTPTPPAASEAPAPAGAAWTAYGPTAASAGGNGAVRVTMNGAEFPATLAPYESWAGISAVARRLVEEAAPVAEGYLVPVETFEEFAAFFAAE